MILRIKNMVCNRCVMIVEDIFKKCELSIKKVTIGLVEIEKSSISIVERKCLTENLTSYGFELIDDKKSKLVESLKKLIIDKINSEDFSNLDFLWSKFISENLHYEYKYISSLFSSLQGITIERFIILQKVEKVKELLIYKQLSLSEIAWRLKYSSVGHLSNQFKDITGIPPKKFEKLNLTSRRKSSIKEMID